MSNDDVESTSSDLSRLKICPSAECLLLDEMRDLLSKDWVEFLAENSRGNSLSRIRSGAPAAGELARLVVGIQKKMSGEKYLKMQNFVREFKDLPGVVPMEDTLLKLSVHLGTSPPESGEVKFYPKRVIWLETFCHITGTLVGQMDVILGFLRGREPREVLKKTKDLLASTSDQAIQSIQAGSSSSSVICTPPPQQSFIIPGYCTLL